MRLNVIIGLLTVLIFGFGCSNVPKKQPEAAPSATTTSAKTTPAPKPTEIGSVTCTRGPETRTIKIESAQPKGCKVFYSSYFSGKQAVAWSDTGNTYCDEVQSRIRGKLEAADFTCK